MRLVVTKRNYDFLNTRGPGTAEPEIRMDSYRGRQIKYIPVEILVLFVAVYGAAYAIMSFQPYFPLLGRWMILAGVIGTLLWLWKIEMVTDWVQLLISSFWFVVWMFALGVVPVTDLPWYNQVASSLFLPVYVFCTPFIEGVPDHW